MTTIEVSVSDWVLWLIAFLLFIQLIMQLVDLYLRKKIHDAEIQLRELTDD